MITELNKFGPFKHKVKPLDHQESWFQATKDMTSFALFWEMGCAKTKVMLDTAAHLFLKGEIDGLLVVSDNGAYRNWIDYEIPGHFMEGIPIRTAFYASQLSSKEQQRVNQLLVAVDDILDILVMNVEGFAAPKAPIFAEAFLQSHYVMWVIDESTSIKTMTSKRTKTILSLRDQAPYRRILTGTPITNGPEDLFAQFEFLGQGLLGYDSYVAYVANHVNRILVTGAGMRGHYRTVGYNNLALLTEKLKPYSSRLLKTQCLDLPEKLYKTRYVEHTPEQSRIYNEIREIAVSEVDRGLVTVTSALTTLTKLHQINCGHIMRDDKQRVDIHSYRIMELLSLIYILEPDSKLIIWAVFRRDIELIVQSIKAMYGPESYVTYYGDTEQELRPENIAKWKSNKGCRFFISNPATGGKGITLTEANYCVYYSNSFHLERRLQSEDRIHRMGQRNVCTYVDLVTAGTVDVKIVRALKDKKDLASEVLDCYAELLKS